MLTERRKEDKKKMKGCKTIAEYAVKKWMEQHGFSMDEFTVSMDGNDATITDQAGGSLAVRYDSATGQVAEVEELDLDEVEELA